MKEIRRRSRRGSRKWRTMKWKRKEIRGKEDEKKEQRNKGRVGAR